MKKLLLFLIIFFNLASAHAALDFDGTDDYINLGNESAFSFGNGSTDEAFSISVWAKFADGSATQALVNKSTILSGSTNQGEYALLLNSSERLYFRLIDEDATAYIQKDSNSPLATDTWLHIVGTYDGTGSASGINLYVDGSAISCQPLSF